jgi:hypothetical protein
VGGFVEAFLGVELDAGQDVDNRLAGIRSIVDVRGGVAAVTELATTAERIASLS